MAPEPTPTFAEFAIFRVPLVRKGTWQTAGGRQADATTLILRATLTTGEALCSESILLPGHVAESAASAWAELQRVAPLMLAALPGTAPATTMSEASPPHRSSTIATAMSRPTGVKAGSTPRSNRYRASELIFSRRPVAAMVIGSQ